MQEWRCELYLCALSSMGARRWGLTPPLALADRDREAWVRMHLRGLAVELHCYEAWRTWWRAVSRSRAERLHAARSVAAAAASHSMQLRGVHLEAANVRLSKQTTTLRALLRRTHLLEGLRTWASHAATYRLRILVRRRLLRHRFELWRSAATPDRYWWAGMGSMSRRWRRRQSWRGRCAEALLAFGQAAEKRRWRTVWLARLALVRALRTMRRTRREVRRLSALSLLCGRARQRASTERALRSWRLRVLRRTRHALKSHQDHALTSLLGLWTCSARLALAAVCSWPAAPVEPSLSALSALGGDWSGGRAALEMALREACKQKHALAEARGAALSEGHRSFGAAGRVDELFAIIRQQGTDLQALSSAVARSEAELLCLQSALHRAECDTALRAPQPGASTSLVDGVSAVSGGAHRRLSEADARCGAMETRLASVADAVERACMRLRARAAREGMPNAPPSG